MKKLSIGLMLLMILPMVTAIDMTDSRTLARIEQIEHMQIVIGAAHDYYTGSDDCKEHVNIPQITFKENHMEYILQKGYSAVFTCMRDDQKELLGTNPATYYRDYENNDGTTFVCW